MIQDLVGKAADGATFDVHVDSPDSGTQIISVSQTSVEHIDGQHLAFDLMLDPAGVRIDAPSGSVGFQMRVDFESRGKHRQSTDGVTFYEGDVIPAYLQLQTEIPADVPVEDVVIKLWISE